jgi:hypothetical protein
MSVVDLYRIYLNHDKQKYKAFTVLEFSDMICRNLRLRDTRKAPAAAAVAESHFILTNSELALEQITNAKGEISHQHPSKYQKKRNGVQKEVALWQTAISVVNIFQGREQIITKHFLLL